MSINEMNKGQIFSFYGEARRLVSVKPFKHGKVVIVMADARFDKMLFTTVQRADREFQVA